MGVKEWAEEIGYTDEEGSSTIRLLVYGETGVGKTRLAGTFPYPFFLDADRGLRTLKGNHFPFVPFSPGERTYRKAMDVLRSIRDKKPPFDKITVETVVIDSLTELAQMLLIESMKYPSGKGVSRDITNEKPQWDDYSRIGARLDSLMMTCKDLGLNVVATAGAKLDKDEVSGEFIGEPAIVGGYRRIVGHKFDEFFYMEPKKVKGDEFYYAYTKRYKYYAAKSRDDRPGVIENPTYERLFGGTK